MGASLSHCIRPSVHLPSFLIRLCAAKENVRGILLAGYRVGSLSRTVLPTPASSSSRINTSTLLLILWSADDHSSV
ncbi:hypothetical protein VTJ04DRAFT_7423 [Mycothermus thermophilus]|uniref:uncharacterized protein n=1 Tax=Humicola insolens TaxID=85995 RepID=UPI003743DFB8